jgi:hypothetical protein
MDLVLTRHHGLYQNQTSQIVTPIDQNNCNWLELILFLWLCYLLRVLWASSLIFSLSLELIPFLDKNLFANDWNTL